MIKTTVSGGSMRPTLRPGDVVLLDPRARSPRPGEVWVALTGRSTVLHRIVAISGGFAALQGDANGRLDAPVPVGRLLARAVATERGASLDGPLARGRVWLWRLLRRLMAR